jgi:hypothetical protein
MQVVSQLQYYVSRVVRLDVILVQDWEIRSLNLLVVRRIFNGPRTVWPQGFKWAKAGIGMKQGGEHGDGLLF